MMTRVRWIQDSNQEILFLDLAHSTPEECLEALDSFSAHVRACGPLKARVLVDATEAGYDPSVAVRWKAKLGAHASEVAATAVYGATGMVRVSIDTFTEVLRQLGLDPDRSLKIFSNRYEALKWLETPAA